MSSQQLGLKAPGLCIAPLLIHGPPDSRAVDAMIREVDEQLAENNTRVEECVKELVEMAQSVCGPSHHFLHPADALQHLHENQLLEHDTCYDPSPDAINRLLKYVIQVLERTPAAAERVLEELLALSSAEGVALPLHGAGRGASSVVSINTAVDSAQHISDGLWNDVCLKMRKHFVSKLANLGSGSGSASQQQEERLQYMQSLCVLFPADKVWALYRNVRGPQLESCLRSHLPGSSSRGTKPGFVEVVEQFCGCGERVVEMMVEDFQLMHCGLWTSVVTPVSGLQQLYSDTLDDAVSTTLDALQENLSTSPVPQNRNKERGKHRHDDKDAVKEIPKSPSDMSFLSHLKPPSRKTHSKSADNLQQQTEQFCDLQAISTEVLIPLAKFVDTLLAISSHLDNLYAATTWEMAGPLVKKSSKSNLKSVLKEGAGCSLAFSPRSFEQSGLLPDAIPPPFGATQAMLAELSSSLRVVEKQADDHVGWEWAAQFSRLSTDIARSMEVSIQAAAMAATRQMESLLQDPPGGADLPLIAVNPALVGGRLDYPQQVFKPVQELVSHLDSLLPLACAGPDSPLAAVRSAYVDSISTNLKNFSFWLSKVSVAAGESLPLKCLYAVLSSAAFIRNHLLHYDTALGSVSKKLFGAVYRQYCELVDGLTRTVVDHHKHLMQTALLQDAESLYWADTKHFYEGERCSFPVQMWHYHLRALQSDLWAVCPPTLAQCIFVGVLGESLQTLASRYTRTRPSYSRTPQYRADILTLLLCTSEHLFAASSASHHYLNPADAHKEHHSIHVSCCHLLAALTLVAAPIDLVYRTFKKGFKKKRSRSSEEEIVRGYSAHWLSWIRPSLIPLGKLSYDDLQTTSSVYIQLQLLSRQPQISWPLLLQSLVMKDYTLPILLLTQLSLTFTATHHEDTLSSDDLTMKKAVASHNTTRSIFNAYVTVALQLTEFPEALARVMLPVFERSASWSVFEGGAQLGKSVTIPPWMEAIINCLKPLVCRVVEPGVRVLLRRSEEAISVEPLHLKLKELPCGCEPTSKYDNNIGNRVSSSTTDLIATIARSRPDLKGNKDAVAEAVYSVLRQLVEDVGSLPTPFITFCRAAQEQLDQKGIHTPHSCAALTVLASAVRSVLLDTATVESISGSKLEDGQGDSVRMLAECCYHILTATATGKHSAAPRAAGLFIKANRNWVTEQMDILTEYLLSEPFQYSEVSALDGATTEFTENLLISQTSGVLQADTGESSLRSLHHFILNNRDWVAAQMDITPILGTRGSPKVVPFQVKVTPISTTNFNPLKAFNTIGNCSLDHAAVSELSPDWPGLLSADLGISEVMQRHLLQLRPELQPDAFIEETDRRAVEGLLKRVTIQSADL